MAIGSQLVKFLLTAEDQTARGVASAETGLSNLKKSAGALNGALGQIGLGIGLGAVTAEFIKVNASMESMIRALTQVTGSSEQAKVEMAFVRDEANRLGIDVTTAANSYVQLSAAAKGTALEGPKTREIWSSVANAMAQLGKTGPETEGALLAISQMMSKGTVSAEELRGQLGERLPGAFQAAAKALGTTTAGLDDMLKKGEVVAADFLPKFAAELNSTFGTGAVDGFNANLGRLKNTISDIFLSIGDTGAFQAMGDGLKYIAVGAVTAWESFEFLGKTLENIAYTIASLDFRGYQQRQQEALAAARADVEKVMDRLLSTSKAADAAGSAGAKAGQQIAANMAPAAQSAKQVEQALKDQAAAAKAAVDVAKAENTLGAANVRLAQEQAKTALELANAKGDAAGAIRAKNALTELETELSRLNARAAMSEAEAALEVAQAKYKQALAKNESVEAAQKELEAASLLYSAKAVENEITEETIKRKDELAKVTSTVTSSNVSAAVSFGGFADAAYGAAEAVGTLAEMEERLMDIRDRANAARGQGGTTSWEYLLGKKGIELSTEQLSAFKQQIESIYEYLRGTFDGKVVSTTYLLDEAINKTLKLIDAPANTATAPNRTTLTRTTREETTTAGGSRGGVSLTINVTGPTDANALARLLVPEIDKINRLRS